MESQVNQTPLLLRLSIGLSLLILSGCGPAELSTPTAAPVTPTPLPTTAPLELSGISFSGRLLIQTNAGVHEITMNALTLKAEQTLIAPDAGFAVISPDSAYLLYYYAPDNEIRLRDLQTGDLQIIAEVAQSIDCLSWAPDSARFSAAVGEHLEVYDLSAAPPQIVYTAPSGLYSPDGKGVPIPFHGNFDCGTWIGQDRLILQRTKYMPNLLSDMQLDTTSLVVLGATPTLEDAPERWYVLDICADQDRVIVGDESGRLYLAPTFQDFTSMQRRALDFQPFGGAAGLGRGTIGFVPGSGCEIYTQDAAQGRTTRDIHLLDPDTLQSHQGYTVEARTPTTWWTGAWVETPPRRLIVIGESEFEFQEAALAVVDNTQLIIVDLDSGARGLLAQITGSTNTSVLGWLP